MLKSVSSIRRRHAGHDGEVFLWPFGPHRETKRKKKKLPLLWLGKQPSAVVLVGRHDAGSPCRPESVADVVDSHQDVASVIPTGQPSPEASKFPDSAELVEPPRCGLNGVVHCLCGRRPKELLHIARNAHKTGVMSQKTTGTEERHRNQASPR